MSITYETITARNFADLGGAFYPGDTKGSFVAADEDGVEQVAHLVLTVDTPYVKKSFDKLTRKAARLGFEAPVLTHVGDVVKVRIDQHGAKHAWHFTAYTLVAAPVHFSGWSFVATINHTQVDDGEYVNLINRAPAFSDLDLGVEIRHARPVCQHCNTARKRNDTFVIAHDDGRQLQVGRNCLADYIGDADGTSIIRYAQFISEIAAFFDDSNGLDDGLGGFSKAVDAYSPATIIAVAAASVDFRGWHSKGSVYRNGYGYPTANHVADHLSPLVKKQARLDSWGGNEKPVTAAHGERAEDIIEWTQTIADDVNSDYLWNLKVLCGLHTITSKHIGIVASAVAAYDRHINGQRRKAQQEKAAATSEYIGKKGDKIGRKLSTADKRKGATAFPALTVKVTSTRSFETDWGTTTVVNLVDTDGNVLTWFASNGAFDTNGQQVAEGNTYTLAATIKGHKEYQGIKQTSLSRCNLHQEP